MRNLLATLLCKEVLIQNEFLKKENEALRRVIAGESDLDVFGRDRFSAPTEGPLSLKVEGVHRYTPGKSVWPEVARMFSGDKK